jgi:PAS domain S-box-containing protein
MRLLLMKNMMTRIVSLSIKTQILILAFIVAMPAAGIIVYSGIQMRDDAMFAAGMETRRLAGNIASEQQNLVAAARQLIIALTQLPEVKKRNRDRVQPFLGDILKLNPQYSNILIADRGGTIWAAAIPTNPTFNVSDRRYFKNAVASGQLSSGEYVISRATAHPTFNLAYAFKDERGETAGVIIVGFVLDFYKQLLERSGLPPDTSFILLDHKGTVLYRTINPEIYIGRQYDPELFRQMQEGSDVNTYSSSLTMGGDYRIVSYRKLRLPNELSPYMYIRTGIPVAGVLAAANKVLIRNLALFASFLIMAILLAWFIGKRSIADRISLLEKASQKLADGNLHVRVSDLVIGGELGRLGQTFDSMARQLLLREQALVESERNYRDIFNTTNDAIFVHDAESGQIIEINKTVEKLYGYSRQEILDRKAQNFGAGEPPYTVQDALAWIRKAVEEGPQQFEWLAIRKNGELFWTEVVLSATRIAGALRVLAVVRDLTERRQAEEEKQKLQAQLLQVQKMESIGQLAGGVAHDFNNILAAIIGYGSLIQRKMGEDDPNRIHVDNILAAADRAASLTQSLLAFSRKQVIDPRDIDLNESIRRFEKFLARIIGEDVLLTTSLSTGTLTIYTDATQLEQVLMNLATNARDAMPRGGRLMIETERVELDDEYVATKGYGKPGLYAVINIGDTGEGMDQQTQGKIFEPFFTTKEVGSGTGLGLSIVYGIVKQNKGYISVYSEPCKGTTFRIYFPLVISGTAEELLPEAPSPIRGGTETILFAEDNDALRLLHGEVLQEFGYTVIEAADGEEALLKFQENRERVSLLILDVIMPKKNGKEVFVEARRSNPNIKAIFTSGYPADLIQKEGVIEKGLHFISKPSSLDAFLRKVREVLDQ